MDLLLALGDTGLVKADLNLRLYRADERLVDLEAAIVVVENGATGDYTVTVPDDFSWYTLTAEYPGGVKHSRYFGQYNYPYSAPPNFILPLSEAGLVVGDLNLALYLDGAPTAHTLSSVNLGNNDYSISGWPTTVPGRWTLRSQVGGLTFAHEWTVPVVVSSGFAAQFVDMMPDVLIAVPGNTNARGAFIASGATLAIPCHFRVSTQLVRDDSGREVKSSVQALLGGYNNLTTDHHRFSLPPRFVPNLNLRAVVVRKVTDEIGPCYEKVMLP